MCLKRREASGFPAIRCVTGSRSSDCRKLAKTAPVSPSEAEERITGRGSSFSANATARQTRSHLRPAPLTGRYNGRLDHFLYLIGLTEIRPGFFTLADGAEELSHLDGLQVVEPKLMPAGNAEAAIGLVLRAGFDAGEAVAARVASGLVVTAVRSGAPG